MKVLFVDISMSGHHKVYADALTKVVEPVLIIPKQEDEFPNMQNIYVSGYDGEDKSFVKYVKWILFIRKTAEKEQPDLIHFLYGDSLYRFLGMGMHLLKPWRKIVTFHGIRHGKAHEFSMKRIFSSIDIGVLHAVSQINELKQIGIVNTAHIEYPCFSEFPKHNKDEYRAYLGIPQNSVVLAALGGTRYDKGLDILLKALNQVTGDFRLIIAGVAQDFSGNYINEAIKKYKKRVTCILRFLTDEEFTDIVNCSDAIVLPYRHIFNGASGPLVEGARWGKYIIGPNHGSLKSIIETNKLGKTFVTEDITSLAETIDNFISSSNIMKKEAREYARYLTVDRFTEEYLEVYDNTCNII